MDSNSSSEEALWPVGLTVAVIENNSVYLHLIEQLLLQCNYKVVSYTQVHEAISFITENQESIELVISDVFSPSEDVLLVLSEITAKLRIPTIVMSWTGDTRTVMKYIAHGACDFLIKPVRVKELRNIWQHVFRKQMANQIGTESKSKQLRSGSEESSSCIPITMPLNDEKEIRMITDIRDLKKPRLQWTRQLHHQFIEAINVIGIDKAAPKKILEMMRVKHLTREQVASHLQKYRLCLKRSGNMITREIAKSSANQISGLNAIEPENNPSSSINLDNENKKNMEMNDYSYYKGESSSGSHCVIEDPGNCFREAFREIDWDSSKQDSGIGSFFWNFSN